jgi:hypothetical protein
MIVLYNQNITSPQGLKQQLRNTMNNTIDPKLDLCVDDEVVVENVHPHFLCYNIIESQEIADE